MLSLAIKLNRIRFYIYRGINVFDKIDSNSVIQNLTFVLWKWENESLL